MPRSLFVHADDWFTHARAALAGEIPCRRGCCQCCIGPFVITQLDALMLQQGLIALDPETRADIQRAAEQQATAMETRAAALSRSPYIDTWDDGDLDALVEAFRESPCPALGSDGTCRVYDFRPITCRMMGIPTEDDSGMSHGACAVQVAVPLLRVPPSLRREEDRIASDEADALGSVQRAQPADGTELLLPYGFLLHTVPQQ